MARDLNYLARRMNQQADSVDRKSTIIVKEMVGALAPVLVFATPIDTSRARANWQGSIGSAQGGVLFAEPAMPPTTDTGSAMGLASLRAAAVLYRYGSTVYIVNNLHYIQKLNEGSSQQEPAGFVLLAVNAAISKLNTSRVLL